MADSVDRVFVHALNTVKRIRSARPPPADRLKLYGLYKQSMEGDVDGVMDRPRGDGEDVRADQEKWDAWDYQRGLSKTEAKRFYISTLIETMHRYASQTPDARELISELEFVWDQIRSNPPSSSSSASYPVPGQTLPLGTSPPSSPTASKLLPGTYPTTTSNSDDRDAPAPSSHKSRSARNALEPLRIDTPIASRVDAGSDRDEAEAAKSPETPGPDVFVDAPDSQPDYDHDNRTDTSPASQSDSGLDSNHGASSLPPSPSPMPPGTLHQHHKPSPALQPQPQQQAAPPLNHPPPQPDPQTQTTTTTPRRDLQAAAGALIAPFAAYITKSTSKPKPSASTTTAPNPTLLTPSPSTNTNTAPAAASLAATQKWQRRVESSLIRLTAELAALREQLEMQHQLAAVPSSSSAAAGAAASLLQNPFRRSFASVGAAGGVGTSSSAGAAGQGRRSNNGGGRRSRVLVSILYGLLVKTAKLFLRTLAVDFLLLLLLAAWMRWKGFGVENGAQAVLKWVKELREGRVGRSVRRVGEGVGGAVGMVGEGWRGVLRAGNGGNGRAWGGGVRFLPLATALPVAYRGRA